MTIADAIAREMGNRGFRFTGSDDKGLHFAGMGNGKSVTIDVSGKSESDIPALVKDATARVLNGQVLNNG